MEKAFANIRQFIPSVLRSKSVLGPKGPQGFDDVDSGKLLTEEQEEFLKHVRDEDKAAVENFFKPKENGEVFNINENDVGRTALRYAIDNNDTDIVEILLKQETKLGGALFTAVREGSKEIVQLIMNYAKDKPQDSDYIGPEEVQPYSYMSPLILAIQLGELEIVELFVSSGYRIKDFCELDGGENARGSVVYINRSGCEVISDKLKLLALRRINWYKALANPVYLSYRYLYYDGKKDGYDWHPIFKTFELNKELGSMKKKHFEFKQEYQKLSDALEDYAVELLEQCRTVEEIDCLMNVKIDIRDSKQLSKKQKYITVSGELEGCPKLTVLNLALRNKNDKLIAHPYSQLQLNMVLYQQNIYSDLCNVFSLDWRGCTIFGRLIFSLVHTLLLPFLSCFYIFLPGSSIAKEMKTPIVKFLSHTGAFFIFLCLLVMSAFQDKFDDSVNTPSFVEWIIFVWVVGLVAQEVKGLYNQGTSRYYSQWWNYISLNMLILFVLSYLLRLTAYSFTGNWGVLDVFDANFSTTDAYKVNLWANSLFSGAIVLSFFHILSAFQVNDFLGPLQLSLYTLIGDVLKFFLFFGMVFLSFAVSLRKLYSHYVVTQHHIFRKNSTAAEQHKFAQAEHAFTSLFWSIFGLTDLSSFETQNKVFGITSQTGRALFGFFLLITVIVAVNMLIAIMQRSYGSIVENQDLRWKVSRTRMWMNWVDKGSTLPSPFNLIPNPKNVKWLFQKIFHSCCRCCLCCIKQIGLQPREVTVIDEFQKRRKVLKQIVERYLHKQKQESHQEDLEMLRWIKASQEEMWKRQEHQSPACFISP